MTRRQFLWPALQEGWGPICRVCHHEAAAHRLKSRPGVLFVRCLLCPHLASCASRVA